ncbi:MAG: GNAT family N-acetyltransferase [Actinomycetales bacterium]|uniref:GNAT family N-acetyltransferase n=1 Tax=Candidatus Phosphoribacter hodrii TaxID=2953743 RepID=A0A9D7XX16_9MICO|nr:GNAT family N-acetyltransferase [Candidatus Phosphoribacter hodrii]
MRALYQDLHPGEDAAPTIDRVYAEILARGGLSILLLEVDGLAVATTYLNVIPNLTRRAAPYAVIENVVVAREGAADTGRASASHWRLSELLTGPPRAPASRAWASPDAAATWLGLPGRERGDAGGIIYRRGMQNPEIDGPVAMHDPVA